MPFSKSLPSSLPLSGSLHFGPGISNLTKVSLPCGIWPSNFRPTMSAKHTYPKCHFGARLLLGFFDVFEVDFFAFFFCFGSFLFFCCCFFGGLFFLNGI